MILYAKNQMFPLDGGGSQCVVWYQSVMFKYFAMLYEPD